MIQGTAEALPKRGFVLRGGDLIRITVLDEIPYESFAHEPVEDLTRRVRERIAQHLEKDQPPAVEATRRRSAPQSRKRARSEGDGTRHSFRLPKTR